MLKKSLIYALWWLFVISYLLVAFDASAFLLFIFTVLGSVFFIINKPKVKEELASDKELQTDSNSNESVEVTNVENNEVKVAKKKWFRKFRSKKHLLRLLFTLMLTVSTVLLMITTLGVECHLLIVLGVGAFISFIIWLEWGRKLNVYAACLFVFGFILIGFVMQNQFAITSVAILYNEMADVLAKAGVAMPSKFVVDAAESAYPLYMTYLMTLFSAFAGLVSYLVAIEKQRLFLLVYIAIITILALIGFTINPIYLAIFIFVNAIIYLYEQKNRYRFSYLLSCLMLLLILFVSTFSSISINKYATIVKTPYEIICDSVKYGSNNTDSYGNGIITGSSYKKTEEIALKITAEEPKSMYLKGFVGGQFNGSRWIEPESLDIYENRELFSILRKNSFSFYNQPALFYFYVDPTSSASKTTIEYVGANKKYVYLPYEVEAITTEDFVDTEGDVIKRNATNVHSYSFTMTPSFYQRMITLRSDNDDKFIGESFNKLNTCENNYSNYSKTVYTRVSDKDVAIIKEILNKHNVRIPTEDYINVANVSADVRNVLNAELSYNEDIELDFFDSNCLDTILNKHKAGNDKHFATVATLMFRVMGVPARYVEGYILPINEAVKMTGGKTYNIKGTNAHAWVEVYATDVGWSPVEIYPEALSLMFGSLDGQVTEESQDASQTGVITARTISFYSIVLYFIAFIIIFLLLSLAIVFARRIVIINKRKKLFNDKDRKTSVQAYYRYLSMVLKHCDMLVEGTDIRGSFVKYYETLEGYDAESFVKLIDIFERIDGSGKKLKAKDVTFTATTVKACVESITDKQSMLKNMYLYLVVCV